MATEPLPFDEAVRKVLAGARRLPAERVPLRSSAGRVLADDLVARAPLPRFDHSAMDGYAVRTGDLTGGGPWCLPVHGESRAGREAPALESGAACRIFTGAPLPSGADAVVMQENVVVDGPAVRFGVRPVPRQHVRAAGEDLARGATAIAAGTRLTPGALALAAMLDQPELVVASRPHVTILCTGDELRTPGDERAPALIPESNSAALAALAQQTGAIVRIAPIAPDEPTLARSSIARALDGADVLVTVGGVSVGDHDVVRPALEAAGVRLEFWKVAIKPGKPIAVGRTDRAQVIGLPGNPASALVTFFLFGVPLLRAMQGDARPQARVFPARLEAPRKRSADRLEFARGSLDADREGLTVRVHDNQASGAATSLAHSDGLAVIPAGSAPLPAGAQVGFVRWADA